MKIALLIDHYLPEKGGAERALVALAEGAIEAGHEVHVFALDGDRGAPGVLHTVDVPTSRRGSLERELAVRSVRAARDEGCDVTVGIRHLPEVDVYWPHGGLHAATLAAGERTKTGLSGLISRFLHRTSAKHREFVRLERELLGQGGAKRIWCVSDLIRRELVAAYPACADRIEVHPNGVDLGEFSPQLRERLRTHQLDVRALTRRAELGPMLLFVGGKRRLKGWEILLAALDVLDDLPWTCLVVGRGGPAAAMAAEHMNLGDRVHGFGESDMRGFYAMADLMVQPTHRDPCSLATLEALAAGVPVITSDANGASDALSDPDTGSVIPADDPTALAATLRTWIKRLADPAQRAASSQAARAAVAGRSREAWIAGLLASLAGTPAISETSSLDTTP